MQKKILHQQFRIESSSASHIICCFKLCARAWEKGICGGFDQSSHAIHQGLFFVHMLEETGGITEFEANFRSSFQKTDGCC